MEGQCLPCMIKDVAGGAETRTGCSISEKGVALQTAGGVPGEDGRGTLQRMNGSGLITCTASGSHALLECCLPGIVKWNRQGQWQDA